LAAGPLIAILGIDAEISGFSQQYISGLELRRRITEDDEYFRMIRERWSEALREAYRAIPRPDWRS
jgi:predicted proteasome-type protease